MPSVNIDSANLWMRRQEFDPRFADHPGWRLQNLTTTQRDALTGSGAAKAGDIIWNSTTGAVETYNGSSWGASTPGTVTTASTTAVQEYGNGVDHVTKLTMTAFAMGTVPDNASLGIGAKFYSFPAGDIMVQEATWVGSILGTVSVLTATPEFGIGSVIASGAVSVLSGTATFEDYMDGNASGGTNGTTVAPDINGTSFYKVGRNSLGYVIKASGGASHDMFLNAAAAWADVAAAGTLSATGVITLKWRKIS